MWEKRASLSLEAEDNSIGKIVEDFFKAISYTVGRLKYMSSSIWVLLVIWLSCVLILKANLSTVRVLCFVLERIFCLLRKLWLVSKELN